MKYEFDVLYKQIGVLSHAIDKVQIITKLVIQLLNHYNLKLNQCNPNSTYLLSKLFLSDKLAEIYGERMIEIYQMLHRLFQNLKIRWNIKPKHS